MEQNTSANLFELQVDQTTSGYLGETARWARFFAILGFIMCGLIVLLGFFYTTILAVFSRAGNGGVSPVETGGIVGVMGGAMIFFCLLVAALYFFPCLYLYNFASRMQAALRANDQEKLTNAFKNLKSYFRYIGILTIIVLGLYLLIFIIGGIGAAFQR